MRATFRIAWLCLKYTLAAMGAWMLIGIYAERSHLAYWQDLFRY